MPTFEEVAEKIKNASVKPALEEFLEFYGYYKQATAGDCNTDEPESPVRKAVWQAWKDKEGMSSDDAKANCMKIYEKYAPIFR